MHNEQYHLGLFDSNNNNNQNPPPKLHWWYIFALFILLSLLLGSCKNNNSSNEIKIVESLLYDTIKIQRDKLPVDYFNYVCYLNIDGCNYLFTDGYRTAAMSKIDCDCVPNTYKNKEEVKDSYIYTVIVHNKNIKSESLPECADCFFTLEPTDGEHTIYKINVSGQMPRIIVETPERFMDIPVSEGDVLLIKKLIKIK